MKWKQSINYKGLKWSPSKIKENLESSGRGKNVAVVPRPVVDGSAGEVPRAYVFKFEDCEHL